MFSLFHFLARTTFLRLKVWNLNFIFNWLLFNQPKKLGTCVIIETWLGSDQEKSLKYHLEVLKDRFKKSLLKCMGQPLSPKNIILLSCNQVLNFLKVTWSTTQFDSLSNVLLEENLPLVYFYCYLEAMLLLSRAAALPSVCGFYAFFPLKLLSIFYFCILVQNIEIFIIIVLRKNSGMHWSQRILLLLLGLLLLFICWQVVQKEQLRRQLWMDRFKQYGYKMYPNPVFSESLCMMGFWSSYIRFQIPTPTLLQLFWISTLA